MALVWIDGAWSSWGWQGYKGCGLGLDVKGLVIVLGSMAIPLPMSGSP